MHDKRVTIPKLALALGYNPHYLKYNIIPVALVMNECLKLDGNEVVWICGDEGEEE